MTRQTVDDHKPAPRRGPDLRDKRWVMRCDRIINGAQCQSRSEPFPTQPPLDLFVARGWHIGDPFGDVCPDCLSKGHVPQGAPHPVMAAARASAPRRAVSPVAPLLFREPGASRG